MPLRRKKRPTKLKVTRRLTKAEQEIADAWLVVIKSWQGDLKNKTLDELLDEISNRQNISLQSFDAILVRVKNEIAQVSGDKAAADFSKWAVGRLSSDMAFRLTTTFNGYNPLVVQTIQNNTGQLITNITAGVRDQIIQIIEESFTDGVTMRDTAARIFPIIGLTDRDARAVQNLYDREIARGTPPAKARQLADAAAYRFHKRRSLTIARTEIMTAANLGTRAAWASAIARGYLDPDDVIQRWYTGKDERLCQICAPMHMQTRPIGSPFYSPTNGQEYIGPPVHPNCRCTVGLVRIEAQEIELAKSLMEHS